MRSLFVIVLGVLLSFTVSAQPSPVLVIDRVLATNVAVAGVSVTICTSPNVAMYNNVTFTLTNTGTHVLTACLVQQSYNGTTFDTISSSWTGCSSLAAAGQTSWSISGNSYKYIRIMATAAVAPNNTTVSCSMVGNAK